MPPHQEQTRNDRGAVSSDYTASPTPSSNTSYSADFTRNPGRLSGSAPQLPSAAAYRRALSELMASAHQQANGVDHRQVKTEPQGSGRGPSLRSSGYEMTTSSGHGQQLTTDNDLLTAPRVSPLSPHERVSFCFVFCCFQQVSDLHSHLLSCLHLDLSEIKSFNCP